MVQPTVSPPPPTDRRDLCHCPWRHHLQNLHGRRLGHELLPVRAVQHPGHGHSHRGHHQPGGHHSPGRCLLKQNDLKLTFIFSFLLLYLNNILKWRANYFRHKLLNKILTYNIRFPKKSRSHIQNTESVFCAYFEE